MSNFKDVGTFMTAFGQEVKTAPEFPSEAIQQLRFKLIDEELSEFVEGLNNKDVVEVADALTDILYVVYGAGHAFGIDLDACFAEVHRTNMAKLGPDGKPIRREDGKVLKPEGWTPPNLRDVLFGKEKVDGVSEGQSEA